MEEHIVKRFDEELAALRALVLEMGELVQDQIRRAIEAMEQQDVEAARDVSVRDHIVNGLDVRAEELSIKLLAMRQPMARDLRMIMVLSKAVSDLERIGDKADKIARMVVRIYDSDDNPPNHGLLRHIPYMAEFACVMLQGSLDALARMDVPKALEVARKDHELNCEFHAAMRYLSTYIMENPRNIAYSIDVVFILKALERIGDHAKNISEYVVYLVKGKDIRHISVNTLVDEERSAN